MLFTKLLLEFAGFFLFILVFGYLWPAGQFYFRYHIRKLPGKEEHRIQHDRRPARGQIRREIRLSLVTVLIFAMGSTAVLELYKAGLTNIYRDIHAYPLWYLPLSFFICLVLHDTYFYWSHRFMHWRPVFKYFHLAHHRSVTPTPWAIFAFSPLEAVTQFFGFALIIALLPLHVIVIGAFMWWDTMVNTAGHTGFELVPKSVSRSWLFKGFNTVTHHDTHHTNMKKNYGSFFNIWDRLMGTFLDDPPLAIRSSIIRQAGSREATSSPNLSGNRLPNERYSGATAASSKGSFSSGAMPREGISHEGAARIIQ